MVELMFFPLRLANWRESEKPERKLHAQYT
jgi:hypothetical protein